MRRLHTHSANSLSSLTSSTSPRSNGRFSSSQLVASQTVHLDIESSTDAITDSSKTLSVVSNLSSSSSLAPASPTSPTAKGDSTISRTDLTQSFITGSQPHSSSRESAPSTSFSSPSLPAPSLDP